MDQGTPATLFTGRSKAALEALLPDYLRALRWFSAKARTISRVMIGDEVPFSASPATPPSAFITFVHVLYSEGDRQTFVMPLALASGDDAARVRQTMHRAIVASLEIEGGGSGVLYDASWDPRFALDLLEAIAQDRTFGSAGSEVHAWPTPVFEQIANAAPGALTPRIVGAEQSNTSIIYGNEFILKLFRRLEQGTSPDLEIGRFLTERGFAYTPPLAGALERASTAGEPVTLAILQGFVPNQGDAWSYTLAELDRYFENASGAAPTPPQGPHLLDMAAEQLPAVTAQALGAYLNSARLLGRRTAEMHLALSSDPDNPAFAPVPFDMQYQHSLLESVRRLSANAFKLLGGRLAKLPAATRADADSLIARSNTILTHFTALSDRQIAALRTRVHGDYHLGQILWTGSDFVIIDFEGEPLRSLDERRQKQSPLKDVAGMLRSFHYAAYAALFKHQEHAATDLSAWADAWHQWISAAFLAEYLSVAAPGHFLPASRADLQALLDAYLLEKAIYELIYELNNRPDWVRIPLQGILQLV